MIYVNTKTGVRINTPCEISGGNWIIEEEFEELKNLETTSDDVEVDDLDIIDESDEEEGIKLSELSVDELKELAKEYNIDLGKAKRKADIIEVILASEE